MQWTRRQFLVAAAAASATACTSSASNDSAAPTTSPGPSPTTAGEPVGSYPFVLGVASGDPDTTSVVLWTAADREGTASVEVAGGEDFDAVVWSGDVQVDPSAGLTARVIAEGLDPDTEYWYRFSLDGHQSAPARTRTTPEAGSTSSLTLAQLSCQSYSSGYWAVLDDVATARPDLVVHCGDYIYEVDDNPVRPVGDPAPTDLDGYRAVWRRYKSDPSLQAAHAVAPWVVTWDDHEVVNDYSSDDPDAPDTRRAAAYRAWWEHTPTRVDPPVGPDIQIYRTVDWGDLARFVVLDDRQHRDPQPCGEGSVGPRCAGSDQASMLGADQEQWANEAITAASPVWTVAVSGVVVHQWRFLEGDGVWNLDSWDGYPGARRKLLESLEPVANAVVLSGDVHSSWASELRVDFDDPTSDPLGVEFVTPGVSSAPPDELNDVVGLVLPLSPHIDYAETTRRGWVLHHIDADEWMAEYRLIDTVDQPGGKVAVDRAFTVAAGVPWLV